MSGAPVDADVFIGVDVGTTALKVGAFDPAGNLLAFAGQRYAVDQPRADWVEQDARQWLSALDAALAEVLTKVDGQRVAAICPVGQSPTVVPAGADGQPLRPALTWADARAAAQADRLSEATGEYVNVEFAVLPRALWVKDEEPLNYQATRWFFQAADFVSFHLTGEPVTFSPGPELAPWTADTISAAGLDPAKFPNRAVDPGTVVAQLTPAVAERFGLNPRAVVVSGTVDAFSHWIGVDLTHPGRVSNVGGTSEGVNAAWPTRLADPQFRLFALPSPFRTGWVVGGSMSNGGSLLDWAARSLFGGAGHQDVLSAVAAVPAGANGLVALPYLLGERTPIFDRNARGVFFGVGREHGAAHLTRALLEGAALGLRQIVQVFESLGGQASEIAVSGGTARAGVWNQIKANATGLPVMVPEVHEAGVLGAAMLARAAVTGAPLTAVATEMARFQEPVLPDPARKAVYDDIYPLFLDLYGRMREPFQNLAKVRQRAYPDEV